MGCGRLFAISGHGERGTRRPRRTAATAVALMLLSTGCKSKEPWAFAISRDFYDTGTHLTLPDEELDPLAACGAVILLALPLALDLVALPVTLTHDFVVHGTPW